MGKRELVALLNLSFWCLVMVERLFLAVPRSSLRFVIVVFPDHTHLLFLGSRSSSISDDECSVKWVGSEIHCRRENCSLRLWILRADSKFNVLKLKWLVMIISSIPVSIARWIESSKEIYLNAKVSQLLLKCYFLLFEPKILLHGIMINKSDDLPSKQHENQTSETYNCRSSTRNVRKPKFEKSQSYNTLHFIESQCYTTLHFIRKRCLTVICFQNQMGR